MCENFSLDKIWTKKMPEETDDEDPMHLKKI